jgi:hypothetical protein
MGWERGKGRERERERERRTERERQRDRMRQKEGERVSEIRAHKHTSITYAATKKKTSTSLPSRVSIRRISSTCAYHGHVHRGTRMPFADRLTRIPASVCWCHPNKLGVGKRTAGGDPESVARVGELSSGKASKTACGTPVMVS